jgi:hypothetical protein
MRKALLTILFLFSLTMCFSQDFDRLLEKDIKTEINLNRIIKSQNPLHLSSYYKSAADSINLIACQSYIKHVIQDSQGYREDWTKIWEPIDAEFEKYFAHFNVVVIKDGNYKEELKKQLFSPQAYFYKLELSEMSLSAITLGDKVFLTVLTW